MLVCNLAEAFAQAGHQAAVLSLSDAEQVGNAPATEAAMKARVRDGGATALSLGLANRNNLPAGALAMRRVLRMIRPDVIHAHTARALFPLALAMPGVPVVLTHHNSRLSFPPSAFALFNCIVDSYVAISHQCETLLRGHARKPVRMILNAASARFQSGQPRVASARDPIILAVGTVSAQKDYPTLLRAARPLTEALAAQGRAARIRIAGAGPELGGLQALAAGEPVELLGARSDVDVLMRQADLFVNCSLWEGFPIAMIEAAMSGLPIVATAVAGNREMVLPGVNGQLVPPSDPAALAQAMADMLGDDLRYAALSQGALESARRFSIENCGAAHLDLYGELIAARRSRIATAPLVRPVSPCE